MSISLAVDLDEVIFDYVGGFRNFAKTRGLVLPTEEPAHFSMTQNGWFETIEDYKNLHSEAVHEKLYENLEVLPYASEKLWELNDAGYLINIVTSRFVVHGQHSKVLSQTANALDKANIPYRNISFTSEKWRIMHDAYLEDAPHNLLPLQERGFYTITFNRTWNKDVPGDRANNWIDARNILQSKFNM